MTRMLWSQRQDIGPSARFASASCYDSDRRQVLLYSGSTVSTAVASSDTWTWDGDTWVQVADTGPAVVDGWSMTYFASRQRAVLVSGAQTWEWDGTRWTQVADTGPPTFPNLCYDTSRKRVVSLQAGLGTPAANAQTWEWDGSQWTQVADTGPLRIGMPMAYDSDRKVAVACGGLAQTGALSDTWTWDGAAWHKAQDIGPSPRAGAGMVFDADRSRTVLFGGETFQTVRDDQNNVGFEAIAPLGDTWEWDGQLWSQAQDIGPSARAWLSMAYDTARKRTVLFGGLVYSGSGSGPHRRLFGDTWEFAPYD